MAVSLENLLRESDRTICRYDSGCDLSVDGANEQNELARGRDT